MPDGRPVPQSVELTRRTGTDLNTVRMTFRLIPTAVGLIRSSKLIPTPLEDAMTPPQVVYVQQSSALLRPRAAPVAARFSQRLFSLDPSVRPLFPDDLSSQGRKLMDMLGLVVQGLRR